MSRTTTDPIADMLTRIRNASAVRQHHIELPHSKVKKAVANILKKNKYIADVAVSDARIGKTLAITIAPENSNVVFTEIKRVSTPGRRYYVNAKEIPKVKHGRGMVIISTSKGLMTGDEAKQQNVGGEVICSVY